MAHALPPAKQMFADADSPRELVERREELVEAMTKATVAGLTGETTWGIADPNMLGNPVPPVVTNPAKRGATSAAIEQYELAKSTEAAPAAWDRLSKEWTLLGRRAA